MNLSALLIVGILGLVNFLLYTQLILQDVETALHKFPSEDCASELEAYWFTEYPKHCIPPPMDHSAYFVPRGSAPPALCLFANNLPHTIKIKTENGEHSCSYL